LQSLRLSASDADSLFVRRLDFRVTGADPKFRLAVALDANRDGALDPDEPLVATSGETDIGGTGATISLSVGSDALTIPRGGTIDLLVVGVLSGDTPNGATFTVALLPGSSTAIGVRSGASVNFAGEGTGPAVARTTLLATNEQFNLTQNPVRRAPLILNFQPARRLEIYDYAGRLTKRIPLAPTDVRAEWDLHNAAGSAIANGVYVILLELQSGEVVRQKLFVAR
jgi:hypothetical protein